LASRLSGIGRKLLDAVASGPPGTFDVVVIA
jgi:hypothetical protein